MTAACRLAATGKAGAGDRNRPAPRALAQGVSTGAKSPSDASLALGAFGFAAAGLLEFTRNHYDRLAHFAFGLLFVYPLREVLMRTSNLRGARLAFVAVAMLLAFSASYELIEWWVALIVDPHAAYAYLGTQGDVFDAQKDESWALAGTCGGVALLGVVARCRARRKPR